MLKLLTQAETEEFLTFCNGYIEGAVIFTRLKAYGTDSNEALFWLSRNESGTINAVCSLTDGIFTYCADETADTQEILMFAGIMGAREITEKGKYILKFDKSCKTGTAEDITSENLKSVFPVAFEDAEDSSAFFPDWYTDASHKLRHSLIHGKGVFIDGRCVSVALTSGESNTMAVISSVATLKEYRKKGYGENAVISLAQSLNKEVYLMTNDSHTAQWYEKMGFHTITEQ
ncbi:MAG: GNAT family N-acetyltransferase [Clostridia bacterium]|nr:GNAT family N-acetyltransferase [Clostridia bacterium]